ncbi:MAG: aminoglycoside phosphotransferase family protein [Anaerolineae bacterium]
MVDIPEYFQRKAARQFGGAGPGWVEALPTVLANCLERWELTDCEPIDDLSINLVCFARSPAHGEVVLKIQGPHTERFTEMTALELYGGERACRCIECDREQAAMLLERILPGNNLRSVPAKNEQLAIGTEMLCSLPIPLQETHGLPHYQDWMTTAFATVRRDYQPDGMVEELMGSAWELFREVDDGGQFLLHGDLHHENMLQAHNGEWKVIDPQGVVGSRLLECGRFIQNHVIDDDGIDPEETFRTIAYIADAMGKPPRHVAAAFFILHLLSYCWGYEMNYEPEALGRGFRECAEVLRIVEAC